MKEDKDKIKEDKEKDVDRTRVRVRVGGGGEPTTAPIANAATDHSALTVHRADICKPSTTGGTSITKTMTKTMKKGS